MHNKHQADTCLDKACDDESCGCPVQSAGRDQPATSQSCGARNGSKQRHLGSEIPSRRHSVAEKRGHVGDPRCHHQPHKQITLGILRPVEQGQDFSPRNEGHQHTRPPQQRPDAYQLEQQRTKCPTAPRRVVRCQPWTGRLSQCAHDSSPCLLQIGYSSKDA